MYLLVSASIVLDGLLVVEGTIGVRDSMSLCEGNANTSLLDRRRDGQHSKSDSNGKRCLGKHGVNDSNVLVIGMNVAVLSIRALDVKVRCLLPRRRPDIYAFSTLQHV